MGKDPDIFGQLRKSTKELNQGEDTRVQEAKDPSKTIQDFLNETSSQSHVRKNKQ